MALALLAPRVAVAQPPDAVQGRALFQEARALFEQGRTAEACVKFEQSERVDPAPGTELGLAACWEKQGRVASAWATFVRAEASATAAGKAEWAEHARRKMAELGPRLPRVRLRFADGAVAAREVRWNGDLLPDAGLDDDLPVDPGTHRIEVSRPGHRTHATSIDVPARPDVIEVRIPALDALPASGPPGGAGAPVSPRATEPPGGMADEPSGTGGAAVPLRIGGFVALGTGAVALTVGSIFGVSAFAHDDDAHADCPTPTTCGRSGLEADESARSAATASTVAFVVGAAAIVGGVVLLVAAARAKPTRGATAAAHAARRVSALEVRW
jgi:hypothetical protein